MITWLSRKAALFAANHCIKLGWQCLDVDRNTTHPMLIGARVMVQRAEDAIVVAKKHSGNDMDTAKVVLNLAYLKGAIERRDKKVRQETKDKPN